MSSPFELHWANRAERLKQVAFRPGAPSWVFTLDKPAFNVRRMVSDFGFGCVSFTPSSILRRK
jgi:hypothetical protein